MEKINFLAGDEKRFLEYSSSLNNKDKIALISHNDLDGIVAAKISNKVFNTNNLKFLNYTDLNDELVKELKTLDVDRVIFTDLAIGNPGIIREIEKFAKVLIIDHHLFNVDLNSKRTIFMNSQGYCSSYICYYSFSKIKNMEELDWLVACACVSDFQFFNNQEWLKNVYEKYGDNFIGTSEGVRNGKFWNIIYDLALSLIYFKQNPRFVYGFIGNKFEDIGGLEIYVKPVKEDIDKSIEDFYKEKRKINGGYFFEIHSSFPVREVVINELSTKENNKTFIITEVQEKYYMISARRQDKKVDLPDIIKKLINGFEDSNSGGHIPAVGGHIPLRYVEEFKLRLRNL